MPASNHACARFLEPLLFGEQRSFVPWVVYATEVRMRTSIMDWARMHDIEVIIENAAHGYLVRPKAVQS